MKGKGCYKKGGGVKHLVEHHGSKNVEHHHYKKGGKVKKAHKMEGHKASMRMDKKARGGRMTPSSPLSGAAPKGLPAGGSATTKPDSSND